MSDPPPADLARGRTRPGAPSAPVFERVTQNPAVPRYELDEWRSAHGVVAGVTGRAGGFDLGLWSGESVGTVMTRWRAFREAVGDRFPAIVLSHQRHGTAIGTVAEAVPGLLIREGLDGHCTDLPGVLLAVTVADCVPVYLLHPATGCMGLLHAGWRGTAEGIVPRGIERLRELSGAPASEIVMHCGVSICGDCYQVGPEVIAGVTGRAAREPATLDLRAAIRDQAEESGVTGISASGWCTAHHAEHFYSHRRAGESSGRMIAYLGRALP